MKSLSSQIKDIHFERPTSLLDFLLTRIFMDIGTNCLPFTTYFEEYIKVRFLTIIIFRLINLKILKSVDFTKFLPKAAKNQFN